MCYHIALALIDTAASSTACVHAASIYMLHSSHAQCCTLCLRCSIGLLTLEEQNEKDFREEKEVIVLFIFITGWTMLIVGLLYFLMVRACHCAAVCVAHTVMLMMLKHACKPHHAVLRA